jgi:hypothetical protein
MTVLSRTRRGRRLSIVWYAVLGYRVRACFSSTAVRVPGRRHSDSRDRLGPWKGAHAPSDLRVLRYGASETPAERAFLVEAKRAPRWLMRNQRP